MSLAVRRQQNQTGRSDLRLDDNRLIPLLVGPHDQHLARIEQALGVTIAARGDRLAITGDAELVGIADTVIERLWRALKSGEPIGMADVDAALRLSRAPAPVAGDSEDGLVLRRGRRIAPRSPNQARLLEAMDRLPLVFAIGPAGTGKTFLAVAKAVSLLLAGEIDRIILSRPAVEAGERLGFLPGDMQEKVDPYLRPIYDALHAMMPADQVSRRLANGEIEVAPLAFMRGRTLSNAFVILDEAQNTTPMQMKMMLTRLGEGSSLVVTGDISQIDLPRSQPSGLIDALHVLDGVEGISVIRFAAEDVVRHPLVARIVEAYDRAAGQDRP